jgi:hypothetical protein
LDSGKLLHVRGDGASIQTDTSTIVLGVDDMPLRRGVRIEPEAFLRGYRRWVGELKAYGSHSVSRSDFWKIMTAAGFEMKKSNGIRYRLAPDPDECEKTLQSLWRQAGQTEGQ